MSIFIKIFRIISLTVYECGTEKVPDFFADVRKILPWIHEVAGDLSEKSEKTENLKTSSEKG